MTANIDNFIDRIIQGDAIEEMSKLPDNSVDMILCDLPYGTTQAKWDAVIPFGGLWEQYKRVAKDNAAIVLTAAQPFTSNLVMSNLKDFKYAWVWDKKPSTGHLNAKKQPLRRTEDICVFYRKQPVYNPVMEPRGDVRINKATGREFKGDGSQVYGAYKSTGGVYTHRYPTNIIEISNADRKKSLHPTQKPAALFEYLIRTYTNEGHIVLDNCIGSGTTAVAAINTGRRFIGIEREAEYVDIAERRIKKVKQTADEEGPDQTTIFDFIEGRP